MTPEQHDSKTEGRGDDLARQERIAELKREIAEAEQYVQDIELDGFSPALGTATKLTQLRSELSRRGEELVHIRTDRGLVEAAEWHEEQASSVEKLPVNDITLAQWHRLCAAELRRIS